MILSSLVHTDFQPYLLPNTDAWALPGDKALELLVYLEQQGVRQIYCVPPVKVENEGNAFSFLKMGYASALSWIMFLIIMLFTAAIFWFSKYWVFYQDGGDNG